MKNDIFEALAILEEERGISAEYMLEKIKKAILTACKNSYEGNEEAIINVDIKKKKFEVFIVKTVVETIENEGHEILLEKAQDINPSVKLGDKLPIKLNTKEFGRIAAQTARNIIRQGIRDGEKELIFQEFESRKGQVVSALIEKVEPKAGSVTLKIGKAEVFLPKSEQLENDRLREGEYLKVYVTDIVEGTKGPKVMISRTNTLLVGGLFEAEVPEIIENIVEIKAIAREAGVRTKMAVCSVDENVDAIGSCIGNKGARISSIIEELRGEKIDLIEYSEEPTEFISSALAPAKVLKVEIKDAQEHLCCALVPKDQLSLAIGNKGQNARLAAKLTGWKIDIKADV